MKKAFALGGVLVAPCMLLAFPLVPKLVLFLFSLIGLGTPLTVTQAFLIGGAAVLGGFFGQGNLLAAIVGLL